MKHTDSDFRKGLRAHPDTMKCLRQPTTRFGGTAVMIAAESNGPDGVNVFADIVGSFDEAHNIVDDLINDPDIQYSNIETMDIHGHEITLPPREVETTAAACAA